MFFLDLELNVVFKDSAVQSEARGGKLIRQLVQFELIRRSGTRHQCCESLPSSQAVDFQPTTTASFCPLRISPPLINPGPENKCQIRIFCLFDAPIDTRGRGQIGIPFKGYRSVGDGMTIGCLHNLECLRLRLLVLEQSVPEWRQQTRQHAIGYELRSKLTQRREATDV